MQVLKDIIDSLGSDAPVQEVRRGLYWTAVKSLHCGLASAMAFQQSCAGDADDGASRPLTSLTALELAGRSLSPDLSQASLGLAAVNSLTGIDESRCSEVDGIGYVCGIASGKNVSVIGHFPGLEPLSETAANLWIIEKNPRPGDYAEDRSPELLDSSDIVIISSTTLINHTLEGILGMCRPGSVRMLLGPSTPMSSVLFDHGIDILSGSRVIDTELLFKLVSEGVNFRQIKRSGAVRFMTMLRQG